MISDTEYRRSYRVKAFKFTHENWSIDSGLWPEWLRKVWSPVGGGMKYLSPTIEGYPDGGREIGYITDVCHSRVRVGDWVIQYDHGELRREAAEDFEKEFEEVK